MSCTKTVLVESPCHPRLLLALTRNRAAGSTTRNELQISSLKAKRKGPTHLRDVPAVVAGDDLELHAALHLAEGIGLGGLGRVPQAQVVDRGAGR